MGDIVISQFPGIAPRIRAATPGAVTYAEIAQNVDLSGETVRSLKADSFVESGHSGEIIKSDGAWVSGKENYIETRVGDFDILIWRDTVAGKYRRKILGVTRDLGLQKPATPSLESTSLPVPIGGVIAEVPDATEFLPQGVEYIYYLTFSRIIDGEEYEGEPSLSTSVSLYPEGSATRYHSISRPTISDTNVTTWNVYRSDNGDTARLIAQGNRLGLGEGFDTITDKLSSNARGRTIDSIRRQGIDKYRFEYVITWVRDTGGFEDESGPSDPVSAVLVSPGATITRELSPPAGVTKWNIYRISTDYDPTLSFQLVASVDISESSFEDLLDNADLGEAIPTSSTAADGTPVIVEPPELLFEGMAGPFYGTLFAWKGSRLYLSDPGKPDSWPVYYQKEAGAEIIDVVGNGSELAVITKKGVQRGVGIDPLTFYLAPGFGGEGGIRRQLTQETDFGAFYMSRNGINLIRGSSSTLVSEAKMGRDFFQNLDMSSGHLAYHAGGIYLFHSSGVLVYLLERGEFITMGATYNASFLDRADGILYVLDGTQIKGMHQGTDDLEFIYRTGDIVLSEPDDKRFKRVYLTGDGEITEVSAILDGVEVSSKAINLDTNTSDRRLNLPHGKNARALQIEMRSSEGEVKEVRVEVYRERRSR